MVAVIMSPLPYLILPSVFFLSQSSSNSLFLSSKKSQLCSDGVVSSDLLFFFCFCSNFQLLSLLFHSLLYVWFDFATLIPQDAALKIKFCSFICWFVSGGLFIIINTLSFINCFCIPKALVYCVFVFISSKNFVFWVLQTHRSVSMYLRNF